MIHKTYVPNAVIRLLAGLALALVTVAQPAAMPRAAARAAPAAEEARAPAQIVLVVDRSDDVTGLLACTAAPNDCSLRDAIQMANDDPANDYTIRFAADYTISLTGPLVITTDNLFIRGQSPDGLTPRTIRIDAAAHGQAFIIRGSGVGLIELRIYGASDGASNIWIDSPAYGVVIAYNVIGDSDPADGCQTGSPAAYGGIYVGAIGSGCIGCYERAWIYGNVIECHGGSPGNGIDVANTNDVVIGWNPRFSLQSGYRNRIRSNAGDGIHISGSNATHNHIAYNTIGANTAGSAAAAPPSARVGIYMENLSSNTVITGNLISGNGWAGVWLDNTRAVTLTNNMIGTNISGTLAIPNGHDGVAITDGATGNRIGSGSPADRNLISGNTLCGVRIRDGATANVVDGNSIGLNAADNAAIPNGEAGVHVVNADGNFIGTSSAGVYQYISGNKWEGIYVQDADSTSIGQTNHIGVAGDRVTRLGNGREGVMLAGATNSFVAPTTVAYNGGAGIALTGAAATGNILIPVTIYSNGGLPVDLGDDGPTPNDAGDADSGPNTLLNYPVITAFSGNVVTGAACANCKVYLYRASGDPARPGGGGILLAAYNVTANASGVWTAALSGGLTPADISLQACAPPCLSTGNTSELSPRPLVYVPLALRNYRP